MSATADAGACTLEAHPSTHLLDLSDDVLWHVLWHTTLTAQASTAAEFWARPQVESTPAPGAVVVLHSLVGKAELNGKRGVVNTFDASRGRFEVAVEGKPLSVRQNNLAPAASPCGLAADFDAADLMGLRGACQRFRGLCNGLAVQLDRAVRERARSVAEHFPRWSTAIGYATFSDVSMDAWIAAYMRTMRQAVLKQLEVGSHLRSSSDNGHTFLRGILEAAFNAEELGLDIDEILRKEFFEKHQHDLCYTLCGSEGRDAFRVKGTSLVHVSLESVVAWFGRRGWCLDECAALLFCRTCADAVDCGSSWMAVNGRWLGGVLDDTECLHQAHGLVMEMVRAHREEELLVSMRRIFHVERTADMQLRLRSVTGDTVSQLSALWRRGPSEDPERALLFSQTYGWSHREALKEDVLTLSRDLTASVQAAASRDETARIFVRKLKAMLPLSRQRGWFGRAELLAESLEGCFAQVLSV